MVTIFGFIGQKSLGSGIICTLHKFPVVGADFNPAGTSHLQGSGLGFCGDIAPASMSLTSAWRASCGASVPRFRGLWSFGDLRGSAASPAEETGRLYGH